MIYLSAPGRSLELDHGKKHPNENPVDVFQSRRQDYEDGQDPLEVATHTSHQRPGIEPGPIPLDKLPDVRPVRAASHQRFLTIATMLKNQRPWLREWLEFYLMMGTEHFILYDNGSEDLPLEILQPYIDRGFVTYIPWPPASVPPPPKLRTRLEEWQYQWFKDALETCLGYEWPIHRHAPCQLAAFADAVRRSKDGVSRWLGILDIDEYIFPLPSSEFRTLSNLLRFKHRDYDQVRIFGATFGTGGHIDHAARRREGDPLQALITESYVYRSVLDRIILCSYDILRIY
jgi:Glycosyltransferase family 92